jgi:hypothetical protein
MLSAACRRVIREVLGGVAGAAMGAAGTGPTPKRSGFVTAGAARRGGPVDELLRMARSGVAGLLPQRAGLRQSPVAAPVYRPPEALGRGPRLGYSRPGRATHAARNPSLSTSSQGWLGRKGGLGRMVRLTRTQIATGAKAGCQSCTDSPTP